MKEKMGWEGNSIFLGGKGEEETSPVTAAVQWERGGDAQPTTMRHHQDCQLSGSVGWASLPVHVVLLPWPSFWPLGRGDTTIQQVTLTQHYTYPFSLQAVHGAREGFLVVYERNSFLLILQKQNYCTQNVAEILFYRKGYLLLFWAEIAVVNRNS